MVCPMIHGYFWLLFYLMSIVVYFTFRAVVGGRESALFAPLSLFVYITREIWEPLLSRSQWLLLLVPTSSCVAYLSLILVEKYHDQVSMSTVDHHVWDLFLYRLFIPCVVLIPTVFVALYISTGEPIF